MRTAMRAAPALACALLLAACGDATGVHTPGNLGILITDAPGDFERAIVEIDRVELVPESGPTLVLREEPFVVDLLTLSNDVATLVEQTPVPAGSYTHLRFVIPSACIEVEGEEEELEVFATEGFADCGGEADGSLLNPAISEGSITVSLPPGGIEINGDSRVLLVDFDVSESFSVDSGAPESWQMSPVIRAEDVSAASSITARLSASDAALLAAAGGSLADFQARLASEERPVAFTDPDGDGVYSATFLFLVPGDDYELFIEPRVELDYDVTVDPEAGQAVELPSGERVRADFSVTVLDDD